MEERKIAGEFCLVFLVRNSDNGGVEILLEPKKTAADGRDFLIGKFNGYGGGIKKDKDGGIPEKALVREAGEEGEFTLLKEGLEKVAVLYFNFKNGPTFRCYTYFGWKWRGEPKETKEMGRPEWFSYRFENDNELPFDRMMPGDRKIISLLLSRKTIEGEIFFNETGKELLGFLYREVKF